VLRYYYLRGTVHVGCQNLEWATRCFDTCLVVPASMVSAIAIAAWKKRVLVACLTLPADKYATVKKMEQQDQSSSKSLRAGGGRDSSSGSALTGPLQLPKAAPACLSRFLNSALHPISTSSFTARAAGAAASANPEAHEAMLVAHDDTPPQGGEESAGGGDRRGTNRGVGSGYQALGVKPYADFVTAFTRLDRTALENVLQDHEGLFVGDGNMGIVQQCVSEFRKRQVYYYSRVYSVLSLEDLSNFMQLPMPELQTLLMQLSMEKVWAIQIDKNGLVHFPRLVELPPVGTEEVQTQQLMEVSRMVQKLDLAVAASPKYISIVKNISASNASAGAHAIAKALGPRGVEEI